MPGNGQRQQNEGCQAPPELRSLLAEKLLLLHRPARLFSPIAPSRFSGDFHNGSASLESLPTPHTPPILRPAFPTPNPFPLPSLPQPPKFSPGPLRGTLWVPGGRWMAAGPGPAAGL